MDIRKLHDAKTVEHFRQTVQLDAFMLDAEHVRLCEGGTSYMGQANRQRTQWSITLLGTAIRHDTPALVPSDGSRHILVLFGANLPGKRLVSGAHYRDVIPDVQPLKHQI
jgi:hypothetical protein